MDQDLVYDKQDGAEKADAEKEPVEKQQEQLKAKREAEREIAERARFEQLAQVLHTICHGTRQPELSEKHFTEQERAALTKIHMAQQGHDTQNIALSASVRMKLLNQGLAALQPTLALGRMPDLVREQQAYITLQTEIAEVRREIKSDGAVQAIFFKVAGKKKSDEDEDEDDDGDDDEEDDDGDDTDTAEEDDTKKKKKPGRLSRLFRRNKKPEADE